MQSPTAIAFRALVMLICLIAIPLAAIFNNPLQEMVRGWLDGRSATKTATLQTTLNKAALTPAPTLTDAPRMSTDLPPGPSNVSAGEMAGTAPLPTRDVLDPTGVTGPTGPTVDHMVQQATHLAPADRAVADQTGSPIAYPGSNSVAADLSRPNSTPNNPLGDADHGSPFGPDEGGAGPRPNQLETRVTPTTPASPAVSSRDGNDQFRQFGKRLQELGATYYRLESSGGAGDHYRFYCMMALANDPTYNRYFQATDADPLHAMQEVLSQVEEWRRQGSH